MPLFLCTKSKQGQITPQIQVTGLPALPLSTPLVIVNNYFEFQVDTLDSLWENDSHEKLNQRTRRRTRSSDDNTSTFFLRKVELKIFFRKTQFFLTYLQRKRYDHQYVRPLPFFEHHEQWSQSIDIVFATNILKLTDIYVKYRTPCYNVTDEIIQNPYINNLLVKSNAIFNNFIDHF